MDNFGDIDLSGSGWSSKEVLNEINSIPEAKPPAKYSTTRAQPVNHNNVDNVAEGDFHHHNNIENIDHNSVQVDDFYYDYNFIDFHEDLSDDFESDGKDSGDRHRFNAPQEDKPTHSIKENAFMETTRAPTATSAISTLSKATASTLKTEETKNTNLDSVKDSENVAIKESMQTNSEIVDDFLSEDYLLPVSTTHSPPLSTTQHLQRLKERHDNQWWPENISTMPSLVFTTKEPTRDVKRGQYGEEVENNSDSLTEEESQSEAVRVTSKHAAPTPQHQTTISAPVSRTVSEMDEHDDYEYSSNKHSTLGPEVPAGQEVVESLEPLGSPLPETVIHFTTEIPLNRHASEIPQPTSHSTILPKALKLEDLDLDRTNFNTVYATRKGNSDTDLDLSTTSLPASEKSTPFHISFLQISGNREASGSTLVSGTEIIPPTKLEGVTQASPTDILPSTIEQIPTKPVLTGIDSTSQAGLFDVADFDSSEIVIPPVVRSSSNSDPGRSCQLPTNSAATPQHSSLPVKHMEFTPSTVPNLPTHPPILWPLPVPTTILTSPSTQVTTTAYWVTGNWSAVSLV